MIIYIYKDMVKYMKKTQKNNKKKKIEIKFTKTDKIVVPIFILLIICYFLSPKIYLVTTARYGQGTENDNKNVEIALGKENTEERFKLYFQWYNVIHELGHGVLRYNSDIKISAAEEEQLVNDFAVAYWLHYGEAEKINELENIVEYASNNIKSNAPKGMNHLEYGKKNWSKPSFNTFNNYGWFQFNCVKESLKNKKTLEEVLKEMKIKNFKATKSKLFEYPIITEEVSTKIINDAVNNFHKWNLEFPEVIQFFDDDPNANYSKPFRNIFGIYNLFK